MYPQLCSTREGWTKNLVLLFRSPMELALFRLTEFVLIVGSVAMLSSRE